MVTVQERFFKVPRKSVYFYCCKDYYKVMDRLSVVDRRKLFRFFASGKAKDQGVRLVDVIRGRVSCQNLPK